MALVTVPHIHWPSWPLIGGQPATGSSSGTHDAVGEGYGAVFMPPKTGNIRTIGLRLYLASSPVMTISCGIYAVDTATGLPDTGTPFGGMVAATKSSGFNTNWFEMTLGTDCTISDLSVPVAIVVQITAYTSGYFRGEVAPMYVQTLFPYTVSHQGAWQKGVEGLPFVVKYDDGSVEYIPGTLCGVTASQSAISQDQQVGAKFTIPFDCRAIGCITRHHPSSSIRDHRAILYDSSNNILGSAHRYGNMYDAYSGGNNQIQSRFKEGAVTLSKDDVVRLVIYNDDSSSMSPYNWNLYSGAGDALKQMLGPDNDAKIQGTTRSGAGSWTDSDPEGNITRPMMSLILDQIDVSSGGGMLVNPGMQGGVRG